MSGVIGNSGFECIVTGFKTGKHGGTGTKATIKNIKTGEVLTSISGQRKCPCRGDCWGYKTGAKTFYGLDEKYYHVMTTWNTAKWGQVQSSGAVIDKSRSVITVLDFYPIYIKKSEPVLAKAPSAVQPMTTIPDLHKQKLAQILTPTARVTPVTTPIVSAVPEIKSFKEAKEVYVPKGDSWLERIIKFMTEKGSLINWIKKLFRPK